MTALCVFCGSRPGARPEYVESAQALGRVFGARGLTLVYGGASVGVMGAVADAALDSGARVVGVMPKRLVDREIAHKGLSDLHVTRSMHERKAMMEKLSDGFIALPGGFGTYEELFEMITWAQLGLHHKPVGMLNVSGYYDPMIHLIRRGVDEGFIPADHADLLMFEPDPEQLVTRMLAFEPPPLAPKWISRGET